jgi:two-component system CheB/CheR fusion protein
MPYRTLDDRIDGLVITFINLSDLKQVELKLQETEQMNRSLLNSSSNAIIKLSPDGKVQEFNNEAEKYFGKKYNDAVNQDFIEMFIPETVRKKTEKDMNKLLHKMIDGKIKMQLIAAGGKIQVIEWSVNVLLNSLKKPAGILLSQKKY